MRLRPFVLGTVLPIALLAAGPARADMVIEFQNNSIHGVEWTVGAEGPVSLRSYGSATSAASRGTVAIAVTRNGTPVCEGTGTYTSVPPLSGACGFVTTRESPDDRATGVGCTLSATNGASCKVLVRLQTLP